jgi:hypothetical protein
MITKEILKDFRRDFNEAMAPLQKKYNFAIGLSGIKYGAADFHAKLEVVEANGADAASAEDGLRRVEEISLKQNGRLYGVEGCYGRFARIQGHRFVLTGLNARARKSPLLALDIDKGKTYKLPTMYSGDFSRSTQVYDFSTHKITDL